MPVRCPRKAARRFPRRPPRKALSRRIFPRATRVGHRRGGQRPAPPGGGRRRARVQARLPARARRFLTQFADGTRLATRGSGELRVIRLIGVGAASGPIARTPNGGGDHSPRRPVEREVYYRVTATRGPLGPPSSRIFKAPRPELLSLVIGHRNAGGHGRGVSNRPRTGFAVKGREVPAD